MIRAALILTAIAAPAWACEPAVGEGPEVDHPIRVGAQCDYSMASRYDRDMYATGRPVVNIGAGRIGQRHEEGHGCSTGETLMVVDCNSAEVITIDGIYLRNDGASPTVQSVTALQKGAGGPIGLGPKTTIGELARISDRHGFGYTLGPETYSSVEPRNRVDPYCGCKLYYPGSAGAQR